MNHIEVGDLAQREVAEMLGGEETSHKHPVDVIAQGFAIEVKDITNISCERATMSRSARMRKKKFAKEHDLIPLTIAKKDEEFRAQLGFKSFPWDRMVPIIQIEGLETNGNITSR